MHRGVTDVKRGAAGRSADTMLSAALWQGWVAHAEEEIMPQPILEFAAFIKAAGLTDADLLAASETFEREFVTHQPGYLGRILVKKSDTEWADVVLWQSRTYAEAVVEAAMSSAACAAWFQCMVNASTDEPSASCQHFEVAGLYGALAGRQ